MQPLKTAEEVRVDFDRRGVNVTQWARDRGLTRQAVFAVLNGKTKGRRGDAHKAAVLLGIKDGVIDEEGNTPSSGQ